MKQRAKRYVLDALKILFPPQTSLQSSSDPEPWTKSRGSITVALLIGWMGAAYLALSFKPDVLLWHFDGVYARELITRQFAWRIPLTLTSGDLYHGLGDIFFPINTRLFPAFNLMWLIDAYDTSKLVGYCWILLEITLSVVLFALSIGTSRSVAIAAAVFTGLIVLPFHTYGLVYLGLYISLAPHMGTCVAVALIIGSAFFCFGRKGLVADLPWAAVSVMLLWWYVTAETYGFTVVAPFLLLCGIAAVISAQDMAERRLKLGLLVMLGGLFLFAGPAEFFAGFLFDTAATFFPSELENDRARFFFGSILFQWETYGMTGPLLVVSAVTGAVLVSFDKSNRTLRVFAISLLVYVVLLLAVAVVVVFFDFWRGPSPLYVEFAAVPAYAIFAMLFWGRLLANLLHTVASGRDVSKSLIDVTIVGTCAVLAVHFSRATPWGKGAFFYPPLPTTLTDIIAKESAMPLGSIFRGRTVNMTGRAIDKRMNWIDMHLYDTKIAEVLHNDHRVSGLYYFDIPGLFEYTSTISPPFYAVTTRMLALPTDGQMRAASVLRNLNPRILAMLGVRYVVTDAPFDGAAILRGTLPVNDTVSLRLYEIPDPNLGNYSPIAVTRLSTATAMLELMADPSFNLRQNVIVDAEIDDRNLVSAKNVRLVFEGVSLRITAESPGKAIVLVPLEYSRCLMAENLGGDAAPYLFRANLLETGIMFQAKLDLRLSLHYGPLTNPSCRLKDRSEMTGLKIREIPLHVRAPNSIK